MLTATAHLVNGSLLDLGAVSERKLRKLQHDGFSGRELIHELITDDWGAPPRFVTISGNGEDGSPVSIVIDYC